MCYVLRNCFLDYCIHKFRVEFGKSCIVRDQENVCVAFSGGLASTSMLHLIETVRLLHLNCSIL